MAYRLEAGESIADGFRRLLLEQMHEIIDDLSNPEINRDQGVHDARKGCKRLRAAYRLIRDEIGVELYRQENVRFRDTARLLAGARDSWVMVKTLNKLISVHQDQLPPRAFAGVQQILIQRYESLLAREQDSRRTMPMILDSMEVACSQAENLPIVHNNFSVFREGLQRTYTRGRTAMSSAYTQPGSEIFHEWRKRAKYLWHQIEILEALWPKVFTMLADELHTLSDYLGDDHDLAVLRAMILNQVKGFGDERELMRLVSLIDRERLELEALARPLGERLYFDSPKTFVQRLETYWKAWQAEDQERQARLIKRIRQASPTYLLEETPWLTTAAMAEILKITPDKVRQFIQEQKLPAEKVGNIWVIKAEGFLSSEPLGNETATNANLLMGTREAAQRLNLTPIQIRDLIQAGELAAAKVGRIWVIREQDLSILL